MGWYQVELFRLKERTWHPPVAESIGIIAARWCSRQKAEAYIKKHKWPLGAPQSHNVKRKWEISGERDKQASKEIAVFAVVIQAMPANCTSKRTLPYQTPLDCPFIL